MSQQIVVLVYSNQDNNTNKFKAQRYCLPKGAIKNYKVGINKTSFHHQPTDSDIKRYEEIRKLTTEQGEDYEYNKNQYRLIAVGLSRQKELDVDAKAIQQIEFVGQLKNVDSVNADDAQPMFVLTILEKITETQLKFSQRSVTDTQLTNTQINKLDRKKSDRNNIKNHTKKLQDAELPHKLLLRTRRKTKIRNAFANNMSMDIKLSKVQLTKIIQSAEFFGALLGKLADPLIKGVFPLAINVLVPLATMASASPIDGAIQKKDALVRCCNSRKRNHFSHFK